MWSKKTSFLLIPPHPLPNWLLLLLLTIMMMGPVYIKGSFDQQKVHINIYTHIYTHIHVLHYANNFCVLNLSLARTYISMITYIYIYFNVHRTFTLYSWEIIRRTKTLRFKLTSSSSPQSKEG